MKNLLRQHFWITLIVLVIVALSIYVGLSSLLGPKFIKPIVLSTEVAASVTRVEPLPNTINLSPAPDFVVYFDINVKADKVNLKSTPGLVFEKDNTSENKVLFRPKESLKPSTKYLLTVEIEGREKFSWSITTKSFLVDKDYAEKISKAKKALPYKSADVHLSYDAPTDKYYADISGQPMSKYLAEVQSWFSTFGIVDTSPLNIVAFPVNKF